MFLHIMPHPVGQGTAKVIIFLLAKQKRDYFFSSLGCRYCVFCIFHLILQTMAVFFYAMIFV